MARVGRWRSFFTLPTALACLGVAVGGTVVLPRAAWADYKVTAGRPPSAADRVVRVPAGGSVEIALGGRGSPRQSLQFLLRSAPAHGDLGEVRLTGRDTALVTYQHRADPNVGWAAGSDSFTYAVRAEGSAVSAAATVRIEIVEAAPRLIVSGVRGSDGRMIGVGERENEPLRLLDFGAVTVGQVAQRDLTLQNVGGGIAAGRLEPPAPWEIEEVAAPGGAEKATHAYRLAHGERQRVSLIFRPGVARRFEGTLRLGGSSAARGSVDETVVQLAGTGLPEPVPVSPSPVATAAANEVAATPQPTTAARAGAEDPERQAQIPSQPSAVVAASPTAAASAPPPVRSVVESSAPSRNVATVSNRPPILGLELLGADRRTLIIGWTFPSTPPRATGPWPARYRAELQRVRREQQSAAVAVPDGGEFGVDWVPHENVTWSSQGGEGGGAQTWRGTLHGLPAGTTQIVRVVGLDENGNAFPPSPFLIAATQPPARPLAWLTLRLVAVVALAVCAGLLWRQRRR